MQSFEYFDANQQISSDISKINSNLHMNQSVNSCLQKYPSNPMMSQDYQPNPINFYRRFKKIQSYTPQQEEAMANYIKGLGKEQQHMN